MLRTRRVHSFILSSLFIGLAGCAHLASEPTTSASTGHAVAKGEAAKHATTSADSLAQTTWELVHWISPTQAAQFNPSVEGAEPIQLVFLAHGKEYQVSGYSGCNRYSGDYQLRGGQLSISVLGQTRMACASPQRAEFEQRYLKALASIQSFTLDSGSAPRYLTFNLHNGDVLEFVRRQDPPTPR